MSCSCDVFSAVINSLRLLIQDWYVCRNLFTMPWDKWNRKIRLRQQEILLFFFFFSFFGGVVVIIGRIDQVLKRFGSILRVMKIVIITLVPVTVLHINDIMCATLFLECTSISKIYCIYLNIFCDFNFACTLLRCIYILFLCL